MQIFGGMRKKHGKVERVEDDDEKAEEVAVEEVEKVLTFSFELKINKFASSFFLSSFL